MMGEKLFLQAISPAEGGHYEARFTTNHKEAGSFSNKKEADKIIGKIGGELRTQFDWSEPNAKN